MAAYATTADLANRFDIRTIGQLVTDDGLEISRMDVLASTVLTTVLEDASGEVESYLRQAGHYSIADLTGLTGNPLSQLKDVVCTIAMAKLIKRRPGSGLGDFAKDIIDQASQILKDMRSGIITFGLSEQEEASLPAVTGPTSLDLSNRNSLDVRMAPRYFPDPATRLPLTRG